MTYKSLRLHKSNMTLIVAVLSAIAVLIMAFAFSFGPTHAAGFNSDTDPNVSGQFEVFNSLPSSTMTENDQMAIAINNSATTTQQNDARRFAGFPFFSTGIDIPEALGQNLGTKVQSLEASNSIPLTDELLREGRSTSDTGSIIEEVWGSEDALKPHFNYNRPICRLSSQIVAVPNTTLPNQSVSIYPASCPDASFPSGHARIAYVTGITLATFLPELAPQILARTAEVANGRVVVGEHYPLDVIGGREMAARMVAYRYHDPVWKAKFDAARNELRTQLAQACGGTIAACVAADTPYMSTTDAVKLNRDYMTYKCEVAGHCITTTAGFSRIGTAGVALTPPDYSYELLSSTFPTKTQAELNQILTATAIDSGYPLDTTGAGVSSADTGWTRLDLAQALTYAGGTSTDTVAPVVSLTSPLSGAVSGTVLMTATASDNVGVSKVEFYRGTTKLSENTTSPYSYSWNTTSVADGSYILKAIAYDAAGNSTTSSTVTITVNNTTPPAPTTTFTTAGSNGGPTTTVKLSGVCNSVQQSGAPSVPPTVDSSQLVAAFGFTSGCTSNGGATTVTIDLGKSYSVSTLKVQKTDKTGAMRDITSTVTISTQTVSGEAHTIITYTATDGDEFDLDGAINGTVVDPVYVTTQPQSGAAASGSGSNVPGAPNTGFTLGLQNPIVIVTTGGLIAITIFAIRRKLARR